jgi:hypothetical protein
MNLISCECCGAVIDTDRIPKPDVYDYDSGEPIAGSGAYLGTDLYPVIECFVCKQSIFYQDGDVARDII